MIEHDEAPWCPLCGLDLEGGVCPGCEGIEPVASAAQPLVLPEHRPVSHYVVIAVLSAGYLGLAVTSLAAAIVLTVLASIGLVAYVVAMWVKSRHSSTSSGLTRRADERSK